MAELLFRSAPVTAEGRTLVGLAMPWEKPTMVRDQTGPAYLEEFTRSSFNRTLDHHREPFPMFVDHRRGAMTDPIGVVMFERSSEGLIYQAPLSRTRASDEYLTLVNDGAMTDVSVGAVGMRHKIRMTPDGRVVSRTEAALRELSLAATGYGQYPESKVLAVRAIDSDDEQEESELERDLPTYRSRLTIIDPLMRGTRL